MRLDPFTLGGKFPLLNDYLFLKDEIDGFIWYWFKHRPYVEVCEKTFFVENQYN